MTAPSPRFEMRGLRKAFGPTVALDGVDLTVGDGEACALVGQNGAGKSTLMGILAGVITPDAGRMRIDGDPYEPRSPVDARRRGVAMIHQGLSLAPHLSVMENIALGAEPARWGIVRRDRTIPSFSKNLLVEDHQRSDRHLALVRCALGELQRPPHILLVIHPE